MNKPFLRTYYEGDEVEIFNTASSLDGQIGKISGISSTFGETVFYILTLSQPYAYFGGRWSCITMINSCLKPVEKKTEAAVA